jgi:hypothetical protein
MHQTINMNSRSPAGGSSDVAAQRVRMSAALEMGIIAGLFVVLGAALTLFQL